jgi:hypothetical protein
MHDHPTGSGIKNGIIDIPASHFVDEVVARLTGILTSTGVTLFGLIDHSGQMSSLVGGTCVSIFLVSLSPWRPE